MKEALTILLVLMAGFFVGSYLDAHNINPLTQVKSAVNSLDGMTPKEIVNRMTNGLADKVGDDFDQEYLRLMIINRQSAVAMSRLATIATNHQEIRELSNTVIATDATEADNMKAWQMKWFPVK